MKLSLKQANALLNKLGIDAQVVGSDDTADKDVDMDELVEQIEAAVEPSIKPRIEQAVLDEANKSIGGKINKSEAAAFAKAYGLQKKDLEGKTVDEMIKMAQDTLQANSSKEQKDFEERLKAITEAHEKELEEERTNTRSALDKYANKEISAHMLSSLEKVKRIGGDLNMQANSLHNWAKEKYDIKPNDKSGAIEYYTKDGKLALDTKGKPVSGDKLAQEWADSLGLSVKDLRHVPPVASKEHNVKSGIQTAEQSDLMSAAEEAAAFADAQFASAR